MPGNRLPYLQVELIPVDYAATEQRVEIFQRPIWEYMRAVPNTCLKTRVFDPSGIVALRIRFVCVSYIRMVPENAEAHLRGRDAAYDVLRAAVDLGQQVGRRQRRIGGRLSRLQLFCHHAALPWTGLLCQRVHHSLHMNCRGCLLSLSLDHDYTLPAKQQGAPHRRSTSSQARQILHWPRRRCSGRL